MADSRSKCKVMYNIFDEVFWFDKSIFFLGLLFNFSVTCAINPLEIPLKSVFLGMYCLMSPFMFSMAPFSHEEYGCAK